MPVGDAVIDTTIPWQMTVKTYFESRYWVPAAVTGPASTHLPTCCSSFNTRSPSALERKDTMEDLHCAAGEARETDKIYREALAPAI